jgi:Fe-S cluster assembly scaffold protein SufB
MKLELKDMNVLPVKTWSWLNVNSISLDEEIPDLIPFDKNVINLNGIDNHLIEVLNEDKDIEKLLDLETGIGKSFTDFVKENKNKEVALRIPAGTKLDIPIFLNYEFDENNLVAIDLNRVIAEEDSEVTIILNYKNKSDESAFHAGLTFLEARKNAVIHLVIVQLMNDNSIHLSDIGTMVHENGVINISQAEIGGKKSIQGCKTVLKGNESKQNVDSIYFGDKKRFIDINYIVSHEGRFSESKMILNGALLDESRKLFRGTIDFKKGCVGSIGHEEEFNLLFSPKIKNITAPLILCAEENVQGMHGANSGKIGEEQLFYMMSRGIDELTAKKIMIENAFLPVIMKVPMESLQNDIIEFVKGRLLGVKQI